MAPPRPGIVRADTIDLQPQDAPSAQDHSRKPHITPQQPIAPHQAAEIRHVHEERQDEEEHLSNAWQQSATNTNGLSDEPPSDDENNMRDDQPGQRQNGQQGQQDNSETDGESDDDMMDKISSSPSISDGRYSPFTYTTTTITPITPVQVASSPMMWPRRSSSLYTPTPPRHRTSLMQHFTSSSPVYYGGNSNESSPFVTTPAHLPVANMSAPRSASPFPFRKMLHGPRAPHRRPSTPLSEEVEYGSEQSSSPFVESPRHLPLHFRHDSNSSNSKVQSSGHHHFVVQEVERVRMVTVEEKRSFWKDAEYEGVGEDEENIEEDDVGPAVPPKDGPPGMSQRERFYAQPKLVKSASDMELEAQLLPENDPLLADDVFFDAKDGLAQAATTTSDEDEEGWETESESKYSDDSFNSATYDRDNDDDSRMHCPCGIDTDDRFIDSGWGGECLRETEDIDFEFVYALHTFVATVEGQANAQKGDTMVLLDDSNSYWWLVRVVKDSTIGYLPAEHIETPTERLARLNKHRNVDLSQTMLGDTAEKTKNPLKKAMRRRNAKTVQFAAPTYIEPSEYEYTTDEESDDDMSLTGPSTSAQEQAKEQASDPASKDEVAPLKVRDRKRDQSPEKALVNGEDSELRRNKIDESRDSDEQVDREYEPGEEYSPSKPATKWVTVSANGEKRSKNGTIRNTDSFFRDESTETRKITLTPNILRDDSSGSTGGKNSMERGPSFDLLEKDPKPAKGGKKEKKPGMLSGLFKRKEKKGKDDASSIKGKLSGETLRESPTREQESPIERPSTSDGPLERKGSKGKLQKSPPQTANSSPATATAPVSILATKKPSAENLATTSSAQSTPRSGSPQDTEQALQKQASMRARATETISSKLRTNTSASDEAKPAKVRRAKERQALDVESSPDEESNDPFADTETATQTQADRQLKVPPPTGPSKLGAMSSTERLSESPVHISAADAQSENDPPALVGDSSSASSVDELTSLRSSPSPPMTRGAERNLSPQASKDSMRTPVQQLAPLSIAKATTSVLPPPIREPPLKPQTSTSDLQRSASPARNNSTSTTNSALSPVSSTTPPWSDAHLRAYMDTTEDIRDLLVVVHDTSGVVPVGPDHPLMVDLLAEERGKVKELDLKLDGLLGNWLARKRGVSPRPAARGVEPQLGSGLRRHETA